MKFEEAMQAMREGKRVKRKLSNKSYFIGNLSKQIYMSIETRTSSISEDDIMEEDWVIIDE